MNETLADAVMDRPREFFIDSKRFCLWAPTLGVSLLLSRHISELGINDAILKTNETVEALRLAALHSDKVCYILALHTFRGFNAITNAARIERRAKFFRLKLTLEEISQLLLTILKEPTAETFIEISGISKERETQSKIAEIKGRKNNTLSFGGLSIYGSLIGPAMEKFHMSMREVVWGISLVNLKMLLADNITSVYLSDDEANELGMASKNNEVYGMTRQDIDKLKAMDCWA